MKICLINTLYPPDIIGGAEVIVQKLAEGLKKNGYEIFIIATNSERKYFHEESNGIRVYRINPFNLYPAYKAQKYPNIIKPIWHVIDLWNPFMYFKIKNILKEELPDIVHINNYKGLSLSAFSAAKSLGIPFIFTAHDYSLICPRANLLNRHGKICNKKSILCKLYIALQKYVFDKNSPYIFTSPSQFVIDKLKENKFLIKTKSVKIPLGLELNNKLTKKNYSSINILFVGNLSKHKGPHILIETFKRIKKDNLVLNIVGKGEDENELKEFSKEDTRIIFHGFVSDKELVRFYKKANICVVPSIWYDNSPMVIYESFKYGTPVVASDIGGIPELIEDGVNGYLFEPGNLIQLKEIIERLINDTKEIKKIEKGTYNTSKYYSIDNYIKKTEDLYEK
ncbi:MAG: glycosyltransferase family 4 protein [Candidatus Methanofastidiosum sp.]|nr:glycosyltransferase family 4 protein [Methanofastidiosum sp.]